MILSEGHFNENYYTFTLILLISVVNLIESPTESVIFRDEFEVQGACGAYFFFFFITLKP